jgi:DNA modification methylase
VRIQQKTSELFEGQLSIKERLPTNTLSHKHRVQRWANFIAGYSVEFVEQCLLRRNSDSDTVIDPFLGCGTTLVTAKNMGFRGIGFDRHPVFYNLAVAKLGNYTIEDLDLVKSNLLAHDERLIWSNDARKFLEKLFATEDLDEISKASSAINHFTTRLKPLAIAFFLNSCEAACGSQTDGVYKAPTSLKQKIPFKQAIKNAYLMFKEDIDTYWYREHWSSQPDAKYFNKSSTNLSEVESSSVGICVTSPPYLNNFDYAEMTRMHLYLLGWAASWKEISTSIRNNLITNTTTALKGKKTSENQIGQRASLPKILLTELDEIVSELEKERKIRAGKKEYDYLVYPYYSEIKQVIVELFRCLKNGGEVHWVVADAALYGIHIKTHLHTAQIMKDTGFKDVKVELIRRRGHRWILSKRDGAEEGLGEYYLKAIKRE